MSTNTNSDREIALNGWALLCVLIGLQIMFLCFFTFGSISIPDDFLSQLTRVARILYHPEREIPIYLIGSLGIVVACLALRPFANALFLSSRYSGSNRILLPLTVLAGAAGYLDCLSFFDQPDPHFLSIKIRAAFITAIWIALEVVVVTWIVPRLPTNHRLISWQLCHDNPTPLASCHVSHPRNRVLNILFPALIMSLVYIPDTHRLAGVCWMLDRLHHWGYFLIGPLNGYLHGQALETEVYTQYGVGWAMLFTALAPVFPVSYAHIFSVFIACGSLYFGVIYILLFSVIGRPGWAFLGTLFAIYLQLYTGLADNPVLWGFPASTALRSPLDMFLLLTLWLHLKTRRMAYWAISALLVGLAIIFETDTGVYLFLTTAAYLLVFTYYESPGRLRQALMGRKLWQRTLLWIALFLLMLGSGLAVSSRGTILHMAFWRGWLECITFYSSGLSYLPITTAPDTLIPAFLVFGGTLFFITRSALRLVNRDASERDIVMLVTAVYGLLYELQFVGRSHPANLMHSIIPLIVLLTIELESVVCRLALPYAQRMSLTGAAILALIVLVAGNKEAQLYPSLLRQMAFGSRGNLFAAKGYSQQDTTDTVAQSWSGVPEFSLPPSYRPEIQLYDQTIALAHIQAQRGQRIADIENNDATFYLLAGAPSWERYSPLLPSLMTWSQTNRVKDRLAAGDADIVFTVNKVGMEKAVYPTEDAWEILHSALPARYHLQTKVGQYEVWGRTP